MAKMKWRESDVDLLRKEVRNFNRKIDRLAKKGVPEVVAALPPKLSMKTARQNISSRADYNRLMKQIGRFTERGSEQIIRTRAGVQAPKFEIKEVEARQRQINAERKARLEKLGPIDRGNLPLMGRIKEASLLPKKPVGKVKPEDWAEYKRSIYTATNQDIKQQRKIQYRKNFEDRIDALFPEEEAETIKKKIEEIPIDDFVDTSLTTEELSINFTYDPQRAEVLRNEIRDALEDELGIVTGFEEIENLPLMEE